MLILNLSLTFVRQSLPSRERELKPTPLLARPLPMKSLPSRERELKLGVFLDFIVSRMSLPSRERELKQTAQADKLSADAVAPFTGA